VYDVQGRLVDELVTLPTGDGVIRFTAWDSRGLASGVYFAVLEAGGAKVSRKLVVTR
jgi:hypothetical protein